MKRFFTWILGIFASNPKQLNQGDLKPGDKVHYQPDHYKGAGRFENGIVKMVSTLHDNSVFVVYNCGGDWDNYTDYTSALTSISDLKKGWL
jgi:hypothetical protein